MLSDPIDCTSAISQIKKYLLHLQNHYCQILEAEEGKALFIEDKWQHDEGGGGITRLLSNGEFIEKAGVNFSHVYGKALPPSATAKRPEFTHSFFEALGVSVVIHPLNPYVPTTHANIRFIVVKKEEDRIHWWFGGGFDLTPYYGFTEDCIHWHKTAKAACDPFGLDLYPRYKKACDNYFYLKHRMEPRGIGGIFFDDLHENSFEHCFQFMQSVGSHFIKAYQPIFKLRKGLPYTQNEKNFQLYRRGRYVEFNLLYDRGTLFGLQSGGRTESILMSLPPLVSWHYHWHPERNSAEEKLYTDFLVIKDWI